MENIVNMTILFLCIFTLSTLIERFLEIIKTLLDFLDSRYSWHIFWTKRANALKTKLEKRLVIHQYMSQEMINKFISSFSDFFMDKEDRYSSPVPVISGDLIRALYFKIITKITGIVCGICLALVFQLDIINILTLNPFPEEPVRTFYIILTGVVMGLGTGIVHKLISTIERRREKVKE